MIRKRWVQTRQFLLCSYFFKPIWNGSLIMVPKNSLVNLVYQFVDNKCTFSDYATGLQEYYREIKK